MSDDSHDIKRYLNNQMSQKERHAFEKKALGDPFLSDAIEGAESVTPEDFSHDVQSIDNKLNPSRAIRWTPMRIAAGIALIAAAGWLIFREGPPPPEMLSIKKDDSLSSTAPDSSARMLTLAEPAKPTNPADQKSEAKSTEPSSTPSVAPSPVVSAQPILRSGEDSLTGQVAADEVSEEELSKTKSAVPSTVMKRAESSPSTRTITGKVIEAEDGIPLAGAIVTDKETQQVANADAGGAYSIRVATGDPTLRYSYQGLQSVEVKPGSQNVLDIQLKDDASLRSEVIVLPPPEKDRQDQGARTLASPAGGLVAYTEYLEKNQQIPTAAKAANIRGKVTIAFTIDPTGRLANFTTLKSLGFGCDEEVIRLIRSGPPWRPTTENGKPLATTVWVKLEFVTAR